ncbi:AraC family transcriptional regulator [Paenibacillus sp. Soil766]|uniref:response regulator transcription factor n=1 Tax=Paenibacillus sp. Soil766 TaxID=1736404 RepID=UPI00070A9A5E|nr:response regulator [Paenibacillus sp. Soil766]KRF10103.1 AraC family transcriptional regulator [Paenibacillus sp. Soil766]
MLKVLIVDDEYYFRQALKISLPWEELGFQIAGEAKNGEEALVLMSEIGPDIVLVDINMPIMDGMEFIQKAKQSEQETKFIMLTGQSEFVYAKMAVQLGVFNYVLKPIDEDELRRSLLEIKDLIHKERSVKLDYERLKQQATENMPMLKERLLNEWLQGNGVVDSSTTSDRLQYLGINLHAPLYRVFVVDIDSQEELVSEEDKHIRKLAVQHIAQEFIRNAYPCASCHDANDRYVVILGVPTASSDSVEAIGEAIRKSVQATLGCTVTIGVGNGYPGFEAISVSYQEALVALKHRFVLGGNQVILHSMIAESGMKVSLFSVERRIGLLMSMRIGNLTETEEWLTTFFQDARTKNASIEMLFVSALEIVSTCLEFLDEMSQSFEDVFQDTVKSDILQYIQQLNSFGELERWIRNLILKVISHVHGRKQSRAAKVVDEVKLYIQNHYGNEELRIVDLANSVHMNYNHLCYVFKKETSITINDYLTELRIKKAKGLFDQGEKIVQHVASQVGYADANYFGKCFKKYIGIAPSKYVNNIQ